MGAKSGSSVDWESVVSALIDRSITEIDIPSGITNIGSCSFRDCQLLERVVIPEGVTSLSSSGFYNCYALTSVTLPSTLVTIRNYAFISCSNLPNITIPSGVTMMGQQCFHGCTSMQYMILEGSTPPTIFVNTFNNNTCVFYVPDDAVNTYKTANIWSDLSARIFSINDFNG